MQDGDSLSKHLSSLYAGDFGAVEEDDSDDDDDGQLPELVKS